MDKTTSIYISHAWGGESEEIVKAIVSRFEKENIPVILDKKDLGYRQSIGQFMRKLGQADAIIIVVSNKYLHSEYCMFELLQIYNSENIHERIFPVVLDEVKIAKSSERLDLVKYWEIQTKQLEDKIRELQSLSHIEGITDDLNLYHNIRSKIAKLTSILRDINALNIHLHKESDFQELVDAIKSQILKDKTSRNIKSSESFQLVGVKKSDKQEQSNKRKKTYLFWLSGILVLLVAMWFIKDYLIHEKTEEIAKESSVDHNLFESTADSLTKENSSPVLEEEKNNSESQFISKRENKGNAEINIPPINPQPQNNSSGENSIDHEIQSEPTKDLGIENDTEISDESIISEEQNKIESPPEEKKLITIDIPSQIIEGVFIESISSNEVNEGDIFYLETVDEIKSAGRIVVSERAKIKAMVSKVKAAGNNSRSILAVEINAVQAVNGEWIEIQYPELSDKRRGEIIFEKGLKISKLRVKKSSISIPE